MPVVVSIPKKVVVSIAWIWFAIAVSFAVITAKDYLAAVEEGALTVESYEGCLQWIESSQEVNIEEDVSLDRMTSATSCWLRSLASREQRTGRPFKDVHLSATDLIISRLVLMFWVSMGVAILVIGFAFLCRVLFWAYKAIVIKWT